MAVSKRTPQSAFGLMQQQVALEKERNAKTKGLSDYDLLVQISVYKGKIKVMCDDYEISYHEVKKRIKNNQALSDALKIARQREMESMYEIYSAGIITGTIPLFKKNKDGVIEQKEEVIDGQTRMYHMMKTLQANGESLGIKEPKQDDVKVAVQVNNTMNVIVGAKREALLRNIDIMNGVIEENEANTEVEVYDGNTE